MRLIFFLLVNYVCFAQMPTPSTDSHWELLWEDQFNGSQLDLTKWQAVDWAHGNESTLYLKENARVQNGSLELTVKNNPMLCYPGHPPSILGARTECEINKPYLWNSAWVESLPLYDTKFGYFEARIKVPFGKGYFPAFWTFIGGGVQNGTNAAEIDIVELLPGKQLSSYPYFFTPFTTSGNVWLDYPNPLGDTYARDITLEPSFYWFPNWTKYAIEWTPEKITWYINDYPVRSSVNPNVIDPVRIILNFAMAGDSNPLNVDAEFPASMLIDYVKVYKLKNDCSTSITNSCNYNFSNHDKRVKKEMIFGNGSCNNIITSGQNIILKASDKVILNSNFDVQVGGQLHIDVNPCY